MPKKLTPLQEAYVRRQTLAEWSRELGLSIAVLSYRLCQGWPTSKVLGPRLRKEAQ